MLSIFSSLFIDDDIDDGEFFDNQLEAYFEQLMQPEIRRDTNLQKLTECCAALKISENVLLQVGLKFKAQHGHCLLNKLNFQCSYLLVFLNRISVNYFFVSFFFVFIAIKAICLHLFFIIQ